MMLQIEVWWIQAVPYGNPLVQTLSVFRTPYTRLLAGEKIMEGRLSTGLPYVVLRFFFYSNYANGWRHT